MVKTLRWVLYFLFFQEKKAGSLDILGNIVHDIFSNILGNFIQFENCIVLKGFLKKSVTKGIFFEDLKVVTSTSKVCADSF